AGSPTLPTSPTCIRTRSSICTAPATPTIPHGRWSAGSSQSPVTAPPTMRIASVSERGRFSWRELPDAAAESEPDGYAFADALRSLPRPQREAFSMLKLEGLSVGAAATRAGITPGALKVRAHRAYKALKVLLGGS